MAAAETAVDREAAREEGAVAVEGRSPGRIMGSIPNHPTRSWHGVWERKEWSCSGSSCRQTGAWERSP